MFKAFRDQARRLAQLLDVRARRRHRGRDAVRGEDQPRAIASGGFQARERVGDAIGRGLDEQRMRVPLAEVVDHGRGGADPFARLFDVAQVAIRTRFASMGREHEAQRAAHAASPKLAQRVFEPGRRIAHPHHHRNLHALTRKPRAQRGRLTPRYLVERRAPAESLRNDARLPRSARAESAVRAVTRSRNGRTSSALRGSAEADQDDRVALARPRPSRSARAHLVHRIDQRDARDRPASRAVCRGRD